LTVNTKAQRREERVDLLVRASFLASEGGGAVRLCNISALGALIEGEGLPAVGNAVELRRGPLSVNGKVVWRAADQAGISFDERTEVTAWFPDAPPQDSVDRAFQRILEEFSRRESGKPQPASLAPTHNSVITVDDMKRVAHSLDDLADALSDDMNVVMQHAEKLQVLDIAAQLLRKLASGD
tara:strand:+ start:82 stop:627 length:546 start_codon:yes stop_codon:yes gene_type:complete